MNGRPARIRPFDETGLTRDPKGVLQFDALPVSVPAMLEAVAQRSPEGQAVAMAGGDCLGYRELLDACARVAGGLRAGGVRRGDRVGLLLGNGIEWCLAFLGAMCAGAVPVPVNTRFAAPEIEHVLRDAEVRTSIVLGDPLPNGAPYIDESLQPSDLACLIYTSGTTGAPKGAMLTHGNVVSAAEVVIRELALPFGEVRSLLAVPLFHVMGSINQLLPALWAGGSAVIMPSFNVDDWLTAITAERINLLTAVPAIFWQTLRHPQFSSLDTSAVRWVGYGGAPTPPEQVREIVKAFPAARMGPGYGLTESGGSVCSLPHEYAVSHAHSVGLAAPGAEFQLLDEDAAGAGELLVRAPTVAAGYWRNDSATMETFGSGWLRTGDVVRLDDDGFLSIIDRIKDTVNRGGENVYCVEVEHALAAHPAVAEVAVVGVPDQMMGEKVGAVLVSRPGQTIDLADVLKFAGARLADFKVPQYVVVTEQPLPRNAGGKVIKSVLRQATDWGTALR
jgi:acyl-CoA synthetase (AMP-forming)/AMP-acid ligase II